VAAVDETDDDAGPAQEAVSDSQGDGKPGEEVLDKATANGSSPPPS
jgi:hypothetical protein